MKIAFDLDGTLIPAGNEFPIEKIPFRKILGFEPLRKGIKSLSKEIKSQNHEIWIYTSSFRSSFYIRRLFLFHGIWLDGIINQQIHNQRQKSWVERAQRVSKYPLGFNIDLLIEDSPGVAIEGQKLGFEVLILETSDHNWVEKVLNNISVLSLGR